MTCLRPLVLGLAIALGTTSGRAQTPSTRSIRDTVIPATPAGSALRAWLDAFNSGDSTRMTAYTRTWEPTLASGETFVFRQQPGRRFDVLSIDLRENGRGSPGMVKLEASYLFDRRTHLNDLWTRSTGRTEEFWTQDSVSGRRFGGEKPVYVLSSAGTLSGGE